MDFGDFWKGNEGKIIGSVLAPGIGTLAGSVYDTGKQNQSIEEKNKALLGQGLEQGRQKAEEIYGMKNQDVGKEIQSIIQMRKQNLNEPHAALTSQKVGRDIELAKARRSGKYSEAGMRNLASGYNTQIAAQEQAMKEADLTAFQNLMSKIAGTSAQLELGYGSLNAAQKQDRQSLLGNITSSLGLGAFTSGLGL